MHMLLFNLFYVFVLTCFICIYPLMYLFFPNERLLCLAVDRTKDADIFTAFLRYLINYPYYQYLCAISLRVLGLNLKPLYLYLGYKYKEKR